MIPWGVVVAGGTGARFGRLKQLEELAGRRVLDRAVDALGAACAGVIVVVPGRLLGSVEVVGADVLVAGGPTRSESVRSGLAALDPAATHVLVHDAARPLAGPGMVGRVVQALAGGAPAVVPVVPVTDSLQTTAGVPVDRDALVAVQTPQGFEVDVLRRAHDGALSATDDATLVHALGISLVQVAGEPTNVKITDPHDLDVAEVLLRAG
jgi:2-C-methyl-D-erythritol 4-phosphate cytidylyltransferase